LWTIRRVVAALVAAAGLAAGVASARGRTSFGVDRAGNRASGTVIAGTCVWAVAGLTIARTVALIRVAYGSASAISPMTPNQKRLRREPSTLKPRPPKPLARTPPA
jgi:hypothetical protein